MINFPINPEYLQEYTYNSTTWYWTGKLWNVKSANCEVCSDWLPHPDWDNISFVNNNEINLLVSDGCYEYAFEVTVASSGTYSIDWGDGIIENNLNSATTQRHRYTIGTGKACSLGYTTFKIRIYNATGNITRFRIIKPNNISGQEIQSYLWAVFGTTKLTDCSYLFFATGCVCPHLESVFIPSFEDVTTLAYAFSTNLSLKHLSFPNSWGKITSLMYTFFNTGLLSFDFGNSLGSISNLSYTFNLSKLLLYIKFPVSWGNVDTIRSICQECPSLLKVVLPLDGFSATTATTCFTNIFYDDYSLREIVNFDKITGNASRTFSASLRNCQALQGVLTVSHPLANFIVPGTSSSVMQMTGLRLTNANSTFATAVSGIHININYWSLDATALNTLFGDLPSLTGKVISVIGNPGAASCNTSIATDKGCTVQIA